MKQMKAPEHPAAASLGRRLARFAPAVAWMGVIFYLSSRTGDELGSIVPFFQRLFPAMQSFDWGHFVAYFILALLLDFGFGPKAHQWRMKLLIILLCVLYGVTDEYHQSFVDGRMPDIIDIRNDGIGAALAVLLLRVPAINRYWRKATG